MLLDIAKGACCPKKKPPPPSSSIVASAEDDDDDDDDLEDGIELQDTTKRPLLGR